MENTKKRRLVQHKKETKIQKEIVKKVSSGGFIFYLDKATFCVYVLLIKHSNGEIWIPKGKLESEEAQIDAAFREIKEEVGLGYDQLKYIDLCATDSYSYDLDNKHVLFKELFINVFSVDSKIIPTSAEWDDKGKKIDSAEWYTYEDALNIIAFNKIELAKAYDIFIKSVNQVNRLVDIPVEKISADISQLPCASNITCVFFYGSVYKQILKADIHDTDIAIVIKDDKVDITALLILLQKYFENLNFHIYTDSEIKNGLSFFTKELALEYITKGLCVYGKNILQEQYKKVTKNQYIESLFIRSVEYLQMVRKVYYSNNYNFDYKINYLKKYTIRLARCIILMKGYAPWDELERMSPDQILSLLFEKKYLPKEFKIEVKDSERPLEYYYRLFCETGMGLQEIRHSLKLKS
ncbi:MAG TPA: NUDIX domain-containing protein [Candidatus Paceibacterota bacterium]|nr:NUDIX domain-containing protein [Candidatus Paceibacterota bacterium]